MRFLHEGLSIYVAVSILIPSADDLRLIRSEVLAAQVVVVV